MRSIGIGCIVFVLLTSSNPLVAQSDTTEKAITILGFGDSITQGGPDFESYLFPLRKQLLNTRYNLKFVGPKPSSNKIDTVYNAGYSGKNAEFLESICDSIYTRFPADIVLLHTGHNHFDTEKPVAGIIAAQKSIIAKLMTINPRVIIFVAQVISSGKLPKYSYIPALNEEIKAMVKHLNAKNVILVNQEKGWDWQKFTIADKVHPNAMGAEKMAQNWFRALKKKLPKPQ